MMTEREVPALALTLQEVSGLFHCSIDTVKRWVAAGKFPRPVKVGNRLLFPAADVRAYFDALPRQGALTSDGAASQGG